MDYQVYTYADDDDSPNIEGRGRWIGCMTDPEFEWDADLDDAVREGRAYIDGADLVWR